MQNLPKTVAELDTIKCTSLHDIYLSINEMLEDVAPFLEPIQATDELEDVLGGTFFLVETIEDLKEIDVCGRDAKLYDAPSEFDAIDWTQNRCFLYVFLATNDAGGPAYFIPSELAMKCPTVVESIKLNNVI